MCLAIVALAAHPDYPLVIAANRDEFHARPASPAGPWPDAGHIFAGRDLQGGGTWLGVTRAGRLALLTNVREPGRHLADAPSRGALVEGFLRGQEGAASYAAAVAERGGAYNGFNLLVGDAAGLWYVGNRAAGGAAPLAPGIVGLSNAGLDTPWPKLTRSRGAVAAHLASAAAPQVEALWAILADRSRPADAELPDTGVGLAAERLLSSAFIADPRYGTRCSTLLTLRRDGQLSLRERSFSPAAEVTGEVHWQIQI